MAPRPFVVQLEAHAVQRIGLIAVQARVIGDERVLARGAQALADERACVIVGRELVEIGQVGRGAQPNFSKNARVVA